MESLIKSDIFFFVATIALIIHSLVLLIIFLFVLKILRDFHTFAKMLRERSENLFDDLGDLKDTLRGKIATFANILSVLASARAFNDIMNKKKSAHEEKQSKGEETPS